MITDFPITTLPTEVRIDLLFQLPSLGSSYKSHCVTPLLYSKALEY